MTRPHPNPPQSEEGISRLNTSELLALEKRLVEAVSAARWMDFALYETLGLARRDPTQDYWRWELPTGARHSDNSVSEYTSSIDSALSLVRELLPDCYWEVRCNPMAGIRITGTSEPLFWVNDAATPALAVCIALVRALTAPSPKASEKEGG